MKLMTTDVNRAFAKLERRTERVVAVVRLLAFCVLALVFWSLGIPESRHAAAVPLGGFTMITLAGLVTARRSLYLPWIPWLLASLDVMLLIHCLVDLAATTGQALHSALDAPVALLIFVFLASAALRHRPLLILYTGGLFVVLWIATAGQPDPARHLSGAGPRFAQGPQYRRDPGTPRHTGLDLGFPSARSGGSRPRRAGKSWAGGEVPRQPSSGHDGCRVPAGEMLHGLRRGGALPPRAARRGSLSNSFKATGQPTRP